MEAAALIAIVEKKEIPTDKKKACNARLYVLGLLDCVGELKRMVFDKIRIGEIDEATRIFDVWRICIWIFTHFQCTTKL